ncbi:MAG: protein-L-isoaspartate(D-aspartate) O-methyltransferase [Candidatus Omnitrophica bacterium]|nr:protein-L-isoaspartate(D-aspartate) O-methyltransferase [Candidatus Omnitrophota bacterium]
MNIDESKKAMIECQLVSRGIKSQRVLDAFLEIPRHEFIPPELMSQAYADCPLPIGKGQTISQPYMVALMTELLDLKGDERVLEIGTGSGYQAAILSRLAKDVYSVERIEVLAQSAQTRLRKFGYNNVHIYTDDGTVGLEEFAPYGRIIVTAGAPEIPPLLVEQLNDGGKLVIPVGGRLTQSLMLIEKNGQEVSSKDVCGCVFVPLIGEKGWKVKYE